MTKASELADALGRKTIADALGVLPQAVSNAVVRGWFPSSWFLAVKSIADREGKECPPELFNMRLSATQSVDHPRSHGPDIAIAQGRNTENSTQRKARRAAAKAAGGRG